MQVLDIIKTHSDGTMTARINLNAPARYPVVHVNDDNTPFWEFDGAEDGAPILGDQVMAYANMKLYVIGCDPKPDQEYLVVETSAKAFNRYVIRVKDVTPATPWRGYTEQLS